MSGATNIREIYDLFNKLYLNIAGPIKGEKLNRVRQYISSHHGLQQNLPFDETTLISKISSHLSAVKSQDDAVLFTKYYEQLSTSLELRNRVAILTFLLYMADSKSQKDESKHSLRFCSNSVTSALSINRIIDSASRITPLAHHPVENLYPHINTKPSLYISASSSDNLLKLAPLKQNSQSSVCTENLTNTEDGRVTCELGEELVQDVIYAFTGIQGKYLRKDIISGGFKLDPKARTLNVTNAGMLLRLAELGYYHDQVQSFTDSKSGRSPLGLLGQGLVTALKKELTQYYGMVAMLQEQLNRQRRDHTNSWTKNKTDQISLIKVMLWAAEPIHRLQWLTTIAEACQEKKGGALATAVFYFQINGDPIVKNIVKELLLAVCGPLKYMLSKWLLDGEIDDPHSEFFIEILPDVGADRLWNEKYRVREAMLPSFISRELANKILVTGKSINFLREVCQDKTSIKGKEDLKECFESNGDNIFSAVPDTKLHMLIDSVYLNTSKKVLDIAMGEHKLLQHLQAMRNYLLLGQGDFIGLLMENLKPELDRPAKDLYSYELSSILDAAIRSTNAQYDDSEILTQLDVRLLNCFEGDLGWDIFTLQYTVRGPLSTMLEPSMNKYQILFKPLWKMKHLEFVLSSKIWKGQICNAKLLRSMQKELNPITYRLHLYTSEMIHFIHQMQYYILFEVIECFWTNMLEKIQQANTLDNILEAHEEFLKEIRIGAFLDDKNEIYSTLSSVFAASIKLEVWQDKFYEICFKELKSRKQEQEYIKTSETKGKYGLTAEKRFERDEEYKIFEQNLINYQKSLNKIGLNYESAVRQFLLMLASDNDHNLQLFGTRLDFNEYYKKRDNRLDVPLMFANMRQSSMMLFQNKNNSRNSSRYNNN